MWNGDGCGESWLINIKTQFSLNCLSGTNHSCLSKINAKLCVQSFDIWLVVVQLLKRNASSRLGAGAGDATEVQVRTLPRLLFHFKCSTNSSQDRFVLTLTNTFIYNVVTEWVAALFYIFPHCRVMFNDPMLISLLCIWYPIGSSILSTHQLGGFAGPESRASLQTFPGKDPELDTNL